MNLFRLLDSLMRKRLRVVDVRPAQAPAASPDDPWADLRQRFAESRAFHAESMRKVDEARRRLRELGRNPPRGI
jgi:hypothetical protein